MNTGEILKHADELFDKNMPHQAQVYLSAMAEKALKNNNPKTALSIFNELTGYYRHVYDFDSGRICAKNIIEIIDKLELWGSVDAATALLNIATLYKDSGDREKALSLYFHIEPVFIENGIFDERLVGLYNNICVASLEINHIDDALMYSEKAWNLAKEINTNTEYIERVRLNYLAAHKIKDNTSNDTVTIVQKETQRA